MPAPRVDRAALAGLRRAFDELHEQAFGFRADEEPTQIVSLWVRAVGPVEKPELPLLAGADGDVPPVSAHARAYFEGSGFCEAAVVDRGRLRVGHRVHGPAIVEQEDTTVLIPPGVVASADRLGNLILERAGG
jgi:N-methylhydantoinase A